MAIFGVRKPLSSKPPRMPTPRVVAPAAPKITAPKPSTKAASNVPNPSMPKSSGASQPAKVAGAGTSLLTTVGVTAGVSLLPSFLNGPRSSGNTGSGMVGDLLGAGTTIGQTTIVADAVKSSVGAVTTLLQNPVNLGIVAAAVVGVLVLSANR